MPKKIIGFSKFLLSSRAVFVQFTQSLLIVLICLGFLSVFLKISYDILRGEVLSVDQRTTSFISGLRSNEFTDVMLLITSLGGGKVLLMSSLIVAFYLFLKKRREAFIFLIYLYSGIILNLVLKFFYERPRPDGLSLINEYTYSFPSGHAMNSFLFFSAFIYILFRETKDKRITFVVFLISMLLVVAIGFSRLYLGVHYLSDVIAGYIAGFLWFISAILFRKTFILEKFYKSFKK